MFMKAHHTTLAHRRILFRRRTGKEHLLWGRLVQFLVTGGFLLRLLLLLTAGTPIWVSNLGNDNIYKVELDGNGIVIIENSGTITIPMERDTVTQEE